MGQAGSMRQSPQRRGAAAVEFAVVSPLFFLLLAGIIEFGMAFRIEHALASAVRRGARSAIVDGSTNSQVAQKVTAHCVQALGVNEADVDVEIAVNGVVDAPLSQAGEGDEIRVTANLPYAKAGAGFYASTFSTSVLSSTCTFEHE